MLRGNYTARVDDKGRIKVPSTYRHYISEHYGVEFYVTSLNGECARMYPWQEWLEIEEKLRTRGTMDVAVRKFLDRTNYYGQTAEMDMQGRILVHPLLRQSAVLTGDVARVGYLQYMGVCKLERFNTRMESEGNTEDDAPSRARLGI